MNNLTGFFKYFAKGILVGAGTLVPGVSGGTVAIIVGVFEELLEATANIFRHFKKSILVLFPSAIGVILSIICGSHYLSEFCSAYPSLSKIIFNIISICAALIFFILKIKKPLMRKGYLCALSGLAVAFIVTSFLNQGTPVFNYTESGTALIFIGLVLSVALVLPAISFSYMLLFLGIYEKTLKAISNFDFVYLAYLSIGILLGILIFSKIFIKLTERYSHETYCFIFGFVICSSINMVI